MKTITIKDETWKILSEIKLDNNYKSIDEVISEYIKIVKNEYGKETK